MSLFFAYNSLTCSINIGTSIPNLLVFLLALELTAAIIIALFLIVNGTHHENVGSSEIPRATRNYSNSTGLYSFIILRGIQVVVPFFHWMRAVSILFFLPDIYESPVGCNEGIIFGHII